MISVPPLAQVAETRRHFERERLRNSLASLEFEPGSCRNCFLNAAKSLRGSCLLFAFCAETRGSPGPGPRALPVSVCDAFTFSLDSGRTGVHPECSETEQ